jgi:hypothetical protein
MKALESRILIGFAFVAIMFGVLSLGSILHHMKRCDCGAICQKQFSCGLKECPTGVQHE